MNRATLLIVSNITGALDGRCKQTRLLSITMLGEARMPCVMICRGGGGIVGYQSLPRRLLWSSHMNSSVTTASRAAKVPNGGVLTKGTTESSTLSLDPQRLGSQPPGAATSRMIEVRKKWSSWQFISVDVRSCLPNAG
jgi:hypothetical protein